MRNSEHLFCPICFLLKIHFFTCFIVGDYHFPLSPPPHLHTCLNRLRLKFLFNSYIRCIFFKGSFSLLEVFLCNLYYSFCQLTQDSATIIGVSLGPGAVPNFLPALLLSLLRCWGLATELYLHPFIYFLRQGFSRSLNCLN